MISFINVFITLLAFYHKINLQMCSDSEKDNLVQLIVNKPVNTIYSGYDMRHPVNSTETELSYYRNIFLKAAILDYLENPNASIHSKIDVIENYEKKYDNRSKMSYNLRAGGLFDEWAGF